MYICLKRINVVVFVISVGLWVLGLSNDSRAARLLDESFEGTGYEESWTEVVNTGNTLDEDATIPGVPPSGAGSECVQAIVTDATTNNDTYAYQTIGNRSTSYVRGYIYLDQEGFSDGQSLSTLELYNSANARVAGLLIGQVGGDVILKFQYYSGGNMRSTAGGVSLALDTWYRVEYKYDVAGLAWEIRIDGSTKASGSLADLTRTPDRMLVGIFGNSGTASTTLYTDLAVWDDSTWIGEEPAGGGTLTVGQSGGYDYTNIQDALAAAVSGDVVKVMDSATYTSTSADPITMKSGVDLVTDVGVTPTIAADADVSAVTFAGPIDDAMLDGFFLDGTNGCGLDGVVNVDGSGGSCTNITISNCELQGYYSPGSAGVGPGIRLGGSVSVDITGNTIYDNVYAGVGCNRSEGGTFYGSVTIKGNVIGQSTGPNGTAGIYLDGSGLNDQVIIGGIQIQDRNSISYSTGITGISAGPGVRLEDIEELIIENNEVSHNASSGMLLLNVDTVWPHIRNNDVFDQTAAAGINVGGVSQITIGENNLIHGNQAGIAFYASTNPDISGGSASSEPVVINGNDIYGNTFAGIAIRDPITNTVTIANNDIYQNSRSGIGIRNSCTLDIVANAIYDQIRGGIHTGTDVVDPGGFDGTPGSASVTVERNKVYGNGQSLYGGGIDLRHAAGTLYNNLVYENHRGGIRFGDWITDIINNTVSDNGNDTEDRGGGIIYDDINADPPEAVNEIPSGTPPAPLYIRNNIATFNHKAGIRACFDMTDGSEERDYNLVYGNFPWNDAQGKANPADCLWPDDTNMSCVNQQYGWCGSDWDHWPELLYPNDIMMDPLFVDRSNDNYQLQSGSPAISHPGDDGTQRGAYGGTYPLDW